MKPPTLSKHMVAVGEFRSNLAGWIKHLETTGRPVVVTQRGKAAAVLVAPEMLDEIEEQREVVRLVLRGMRDVSAGRHVADEEVWAEVDEIIASAERNRAHSVE